MIASNREARMPKAFACGSMVRIDHFVCSFPRCARKTAHN
jgi:hypothetical protein